MKSSLKKSIAKFLNFSNGSLMENTSNVITEQLVFQKGSEKNW